MPTRITPIPSERTRGWHDVIAGGPGVADSLKWVRKKADDTYELVEVVGNGGAATGKYRDNLVTSDGDGGLTLVADSDGNPVYVLRSLE